jgi:hypothetical protein
MKNLMLLGCSSLKTQVLCSHNHRQLYVYFILAEDCKMTTKGLEYRGHISVTISGRTCQRWDRQYPHRQDYGGYLPGRSSDHENYCRNPKDDSDVNGPWCYTTDSDKRWEHCNIPLCGKCYMENCQCL